MNIPSVDTTEFNNPVAPPKTRGEITATAGVWKDRQDIKKITRQHSRYALIASTAIKHKLTLKTQDAKHFKFINNLSVVN